MSSLDGKRKGRIVAGAVGFLFSVGYTLQATQLPFGELSSPGAAVFPMIVGVSLIVISLLTILEAWRTEAVTGSIEFPTGKDLLRLLLAALSVISYIVILPFLGQLLTSFLFVAALLRLLSELSWVRIILYTAAISLLSFWFFVELLGVPLPSGILGS